MYIIYINKYIGNNCTNNNCKYNTLYNRIIITIIIMNVLYKSNIRNTVIYGRSEFVDQLGVVHDYL